jgi:spermidine synthase
LVRERLAKRGVFQQWVQLHHIYEQDFTAVVNTLCQVFPDVALFYGGGQGILVASMAPLRASHARLAELETRASVREVEPFQRPLAALVEDVLVLNDGLRAFLAASATKAGEPVERLVSTDDNLYIEYQTPRGNVLPWETRDVLVEGLRRYRDPDAIQALVVP